MANTKITVTLIGMEVLHRLMNLHLDPLVQGGCCIDFEMPTTDLTDLTLDQFSERHLAPAVAAMGAHLERQIGEPPAFLEDLELRQSYEGLAARSTFERFAVRVEMDKPLTQALIIVNLTAQVRRA